MARTFTGLLVVSYVGLLMATVAAGGDEFAVLLPDMDVLAAEAIADLLTLLVAGACTDPEPLTIGIGYADRQPDMDPADLLAAADTMLLEDKRARHAGSEAAAAL